MCGKLRGMQRGYRSLLAGLLLSWVLVSCQEIGAVPAEVVLGYEGSGVINIWESPGVPWEIYADDAWISISPTTGIGPALVEVRVHPEQLPDAPYVEGKMRYYGTSEAAIRVVVPQVEITGQVRLPPVAAGKVQASAVPLQLKDAQPVPGPQTRILVRYRKAPVFPAGVQSKAFNASLGTYTLTASDPQQLLSQLRQDSNVIWAEFDGRVFRQSEVSEPSDEYYPRQWYLRITGQRWSYLGSYSRPVNVAVIDTGVRYDHPDLQGRLIGPGQGALDLVDVDYNPTDPNDVDSVLAGSHGTHVTGIIVARTGPNDLPASCWEGESNCSESGMVGAAWSAPVKVLPLRVLDATGSGSFENVALAVRYAAGLPISLAGVTYTNPQPVQIINLSLGTSTYSSVMCEAVTAALQRGVLVVAAGGNGGSPRYFYPAACQGAIAVAATNLNAGDTPQPTWYTQYNDRISLAAPGGDNNQFTNGLTCTSPQTGEEFTCPDGILSAAWDYLNDRPTYAFRMGTSQASPQVAAALALLLSSNRAATPAQAWQLLRTSLTDLGSVGTDNYYGEGLLNQVGAMGWDLPPGRFQLRLVTQNRSVLIDGDGYFSTHALAGLQYVQICRDDSDNQLCDPNELYKGLSVLVPSQPTYHMGVLTPPVPVVP